MKDYITISIDAAHTLIRRLKTELSEVEISVKFIEVTGGLNHPIQIRRINNTLNNLRTLINNLLSLTVTMRNANSANARVNTRVLFTNVNLESGMCVNLFGDI